MWWLRIKIECCNCRDCTCKMWRLWRHFKLQWHQGLRFSSCRTITINLSAENYCVAYSHDYLFLKYNTLSCFWMGILGNDYARIQPSTIFCNTELWPWTDEPWTFISDTLFTMIGCNMFSLWEQEIPENTMPLFVVKAGLRFSRSRTIKLTPHHLLINCRSTLSTSKVLQVNPKIFNINKHEPNQTIRSTFLFEHCSRGGSEGENGISMSLFVTTSWIYSHILWIKYFCLDSLTGS